MVELVATLALMGMLAGIAVPVLLRWADYWELRAAVERLAADLRECQSRAEAEGVYYELRFWRTHPDYVMYRGVNPVRSVQHRPGIEYLYGTYPLPGTHLRFTPRGTGTQGVTIWLRNRSGDRLAARVYLDSGAVVTLAP